MSWVSAFWVNMVICAVLAVAGNVLLVFALRSTDLSVLGPINAYKAVLSLVLGVFLIGEVPTAFGLVGVLLILAGSYFVVDRAPNQPHGDAFLRFFRDRGVQLRFAALVFSATEAVFLKRAVLHSSPVTTFLFWSILGLPVAAAAIAFLLRGDVGSEILRFRHHWRTYLWLALTTGVMQLADPPYFRQAASGIFAGAVPAIDPDQRVPGLPLLPGAQHSETSARLGDHGRGGGADCRARAGRVIGRLS